MWKRIYFIVSVLVSSLSAMAQQQIPYQNTFLPLEERLQDLVSRMTIAEKCAQLLHESPAIPRLGIPEYNWWNEALHGVARFGRATVFPQPIGLAATFDPDLIYRMAVAISDEARAKYNAALALDNRTQYTGLTFWSPNINIFRDARWGRGMETWGEDPWLTSRMGVAFVKGMQGDHPRYLKTTTCMKHFAAHSGPEGERHSFNAEPPLKDLYETYLPAFEALVREGKVESVMGAYSALYGEPTCASDLLLNRLLRGEWGFKGHVVSDCWAIRDFHEGHKVIASDFKSDRNDIGLPPTQLKYLRELRAMHPDTPLIILVTGGSPVNLREIYSLADALLFVWYPGERGGDAVANVLFGDVSPSGKLSVTFPMDETQLPPYKDYSMVERTYKYATTSPMFPFGFGLTYSSIELADLSIERVSTANNRSMKIASGSFTSNDTLVVSFAASNTGEYATGEVVQCYQQTAGTRFRTPLFDLKEFIRIHLLPGEKRSYSFRIPVCRLVDFDEEGRRVLVKGKHKLFISTSLPIDRSRQLGSGKWLEQDLNCL